MELDPRLTAIGMTLAPGPEASGSGINGVPAGVPAGLPEDYVEFMKSFDGAEGWVGDEYLALWPSAELEANNATLDTEHLSPGLTLIGTDGGGEAYGFDLRNRCRVVRVPLVGLSWELAIPIAVSFTDWLVGASSRAAPRSTDARWRGQNIVEVKPVLLGGDPVDRSNKRVVPRSAALRVSRWWNDQIGRLTRSRR